MTPLAASKEKPGLHHRPLFVHPVAVSFLQKHTPPLKRRHDFENYFSWSHKEYPLNHHLVTTFPKHSKNYHRKEQPEVVIKHPQKQPVFQQLL